MLELLRRCCDLSFLLRRSAIKFGAVVLDVAEVVAPLSDSFSQSFAKPNRRLSSKFWILLADVCHVELVIKAVAIFAESFLENVHGCHFSNEG